MPYPMEKHFDFDPCPNDPHNTGEKCKSKIIDELLVRAFNEAFGKKVNPS